MPRVTYYFCDGVRLERNLFDYKAGIWSSLSGFRGLELKVTESQSEGNTEVRREQEKGRNLYVSIQGQGPSPGVPGSVLEVWYAHLQMASL